MVTWSLRGLNTASIHSFAFNSILGAYPDLYGGKDIRRQILSHIKVSNSLVYEEMKIREVLNMEKEGKRWTEGVQQAQEDDSLRCR
ncbi:hypothetical protein [Methanosarcina acetivorans]|uniref:hypothetical protein n=1 Tax=Methanosarcina acetivorans TaxID=2214 RepID=UPI0013899722|nr:hypothetical protein [Methanosarcina acetivorans]